MVWTGRSALTHAGGALDDLLEATGAPITARRPWLQVWVDHTPAFTPLVVGVGSSQRLDAVAVLATRHIGPLVSVCDVGRGPSDYQVLSARDPTAARSLAEAVAGALKALRRPWLLRIDQLPTHDAVVSELVRRLPHARSSPGVGSPTVRLHGPREVAAYLSANGREAARKGRSRLRKEDLAFDVTVVSEASAIESHLDDVAAVRRRRDHEVRGHSALDDDRDAALWRGLILAHAERGEVDLVVGRIGAGVAAYAVVFTDAGAQRIWDVRHNPEFARFNPGRLLAKVLLERALGDQDATELDWMNGEEPYKLSMANAVVPHVALRAASSRALLALDAAWSRRRG